MNQYNWKNAFPDTPESFKNKVSATLSSLPDKRENEEMENKKIYKKGFSKKKIIVALVAAMIVGTTVFAAGKISSIYGSSSIIPTYTVLPTVERVKKDFQFNPKLIQTFDNGYAFANGYTSKEEGRDDKGNTVRKIKTLDFTYAKGKETISLYMENESERLSEKSEKDTVIATDNGIKLYYNAYANKSVPGDYKMTEQDKQDKLSGKYVFSYGSDKEEISQVQNLDWTQDGVHYAFLAVDSSLSKEELAKMAQQMINTK